MIYFDNAATSKPYPEVLSVYAKLAGELIGNPSSANGLGGKAKEYLEKARGQIKDTLGAEDFELYFTSGATESNNDALLGYARRHKKEGNKIISSKVEHASVISVLNELEKEGFQIVYLPNQKDGSIALKDLQEALDGQVILVCLMWVNNEIGTVYPIADFASYVHKYSHAAFMSDLTSALGKTLIDFKALDLFTMSSHKVGGLKSSGLLGVKKGINIDPIIYGGGQEDGERPGTVNVPLACSLATALRLNIGKYAQRREKAEVLYNYLVGELKKMEDDVYLTSPLGGCPFILNFALKHYKASVVVEALSAREVYVSTRSACSSHAKGGSSVLKACGYGEDVYDNAIRLSFEGEEDLQDGKDFIRILKEILLGLKKDR